MVRSKNKMQKSLDIIKGCMCIHCAAVIELSYSSLITNPTDVLV